MDLVFSLFLTIVRSIYWYKLFSDQSINKEVRILLRRNAILNWPRHVDKIRTEKWSSMQ